MGVVDVGTQRTDLIKDSRLIRRQILSQIEGLKNRFLMLRLMLDDHLVDVPVTEQGQRRFQVRGLEQGQGISPDLIDVFEGFTPIKESQITACPTWIVKRVVDLVIAGVVGRPASNLTQ